MASSRHVVLCRTRIGWLFLCCSIYGGELFERAVSDDFVLTEKACVCFIRQICEGIAFMHSRSIIHLDMKVRRVVTPVALDYYLYWKTSAPMAYLGRVRYRAVTLCLCWSSIPTFVALPGKHSMDSLYTSESAMRCSLNLVKDLTHALDEN